MDRKHTQKLDAAVARIQARFGSRALTRGQPPALLADRPADRPHISTGFAELDDLLGIGGLPKGTVCEIVGQPTSGKTTLALKFLAQAQAYGPVAYVDQARYFDAEYAHRCGVDLSRLLVGLPYDLTESLAAAEALVRSESLSALVFDALDDLWIDAGAAEQVGAFLSRLPAPLAHSGQVLLFVHAQAAQATPLAHAAALRLQIRRERWLRQHGDVRGYEARVEVLKNRLGPSGRSATLTIEFNGTVQGEGL
jgi:recombination protein RecA